MADALFAGWLIVVVLTPLPVGLWAYRRSNRKSLLVIPMAMLFIPIAWFAALVPVRFLFADGYWPWMSWGPSIATTLVIVEGVRRLERQLS